MSKYRRNIGTEEPEQQAEERTGRPKRVPVGTKNVLTAPPRKGFFQRFVNDVGDRIQTFLDAGYKTVKDPEIQVADPVAGQDSPIGTTTSKHVGMGTKAFLMEIPQEWYDEDQKAKQDDIDRREESMKRAFSKNPDREGQYGNIDIEHPNR